MCCRVSGCFVLLQSCDTRLVPRPVPTMPKIEIAGTARPGKTAACDSRPHHTFLTGAEKWGLLHLQLPHDGSIYSEGSRKSAAVQQTVGQNGTFSDKKDNFPATHQPRTFFAAHTALRVFVWYEPGLCPSQIRQAQRSPKPVRHRSETGNSPPKLEQLSQARRLSRALWTLVLPRSDVFVGSVVTELHRKMSSCAFMVLLSYGSVSCIVYRRYRVLYASANQAHAVERTRPIARNSPFPRFFRPHPNYPLSHPPAAWCGCACTPAFSTATTHHATTERLLRETGVALLLASLALPKSHRAGIVDVGVIGHHDGAPSKLRSCRSLAHLRSPRLAIFSQLVHLLQNHLGGPGVAVGLPGFEAGRVFCRK